jgi:hypothetical protein
MGLLWNWKKPEPVFDPLLDEPVDLGGLRTTLRETRLQAIAMRDHDWMTSSEKGLATTVVYLIDRLEQESHE